MKHPNIKYEHCVIITSEEEFNHVNSLNRFLSNTYQFYKNQDEDNLYIRASTGKFSHGEPLNPYKLISYSEFKELISDTKEIDLVLW